MALVEGRRQGEAPPNLWSMSETPKAEFAWTSGEDHIVEHASSQHGRRLFCRRCGSTLGSLTTRRPTFMHLAAGTLDGTPPVTRAMHLDAGSKAPWYEIEAG